MNESTKVWWFVAVLAMIGSGFAAAIASADIASESDVKSSSATIYVPDNFTKIQWAVDNATDGDTIIVREGTYYENVVVNKSLILRGIDRDTTIIDGRGSGDVINVTADKCVINGFTVQNTGSWLNAGIKLKMSNNTTIANNNVSNNTFGILLSYSSNDILTENIMSNN